VLQQADVVFLMRRAAELDLPLRPAAALCEGRRVIQPDIAPGGDRSRNKATEVALVG
jgi:hypothetical protein